MLLEKIANSCKTCDLTSISLDNLSHRKVSDSDGYELHFKGSLDDEEFNIIKGIVAEHGFGFQEYDDGRLIIYTPKAEELCQV